MFKVVWIGVAASQEGERRDTNKSLRGPLKTFQVRGTGKKKKRGAREMTQHLRPLGVLVGISVSFSAATWSKHHILQF